ncbi:DUF761 domain protein [Quillaja saponaria]|uniref:DUF761 domain protein n=1 Tax=Quillaja saponaria TaxID=32244 RepID=A0AAD7PZ22_QUISA|nr:DUF761 domain protein [Quillaja saponaria]
MKNRASGLLKEIIATLTSMVKAKTLALKTKTSAIKTRLVIFSLLKNKKFMMSSMSQKFQSLLGHHSHAKDDENSEDGVDQSKAIVLYNNANTYESFPNPSHTQYLEDKGYHDGYDNDGYYDDDKYPDLTHSLFDSEDLDLEGSVIDLVKNSKEEAGQEFSLEEEIDQVADLFIKKFHRQMLMQKQQSFKRYQEMLQRGA